LTMAADAATAQGFSPAS